MRARNLKPGLFKNELLGASDPMNTLVFQGLWCIADREGRLEDRPLRIHVEVNPYRDSASTVQALDWLVLHGFVIRYEVGGEKYLQVANFRVHQQPHIKEAPSKIPAQQNQQVVEAQDKHRASTEQARLIPSSLTPDSLIPSSLTPDTSSSAAPPSTDVPRGLELIAAMSPKPGEPADIGQVAARIFGHWCETWEHPRAKLDTKRRRLIRAALGLGYSEADLCQSISGYRNSPYHTGRNESRTVYDNIGLLLRDADHIDKGLAFYRDPPRTDLSVKTLQAIDQVAGWVPLELRDAVG
jgi:hypothetical protein